MVVGGGSGLVGIQLCHNGSAIDYDRKFCDSGSDLLVNKEILDNFGSLDMSQNQL